jgi:multicomponent Na+:H+ antiporter subunit C
MISFSLFNYWAVIVLMMVGFYTLISRDNLVKKLIGLNIFQTSVIMMYVSFGKISGGTAPILVESGDHGTGTGDGHGVQTTGDVAHSVVESAEVLYSNPIPHVLMLTAIVVGVATLALGLSLVVRINEAYGTIEEDEIVRQDNAA